MTTSELQTLSNAIVNAIPRNVSFNDGMAAFGLTIITAINGLQVPMTEKVAHLEYFIKVLREAL